MPGPASRAEGGDASRGGRSRRGTGLPVRAYNRGDSVKVRGDHSCRQALRDFTHALCDVPDGETRQGFSLKVSSIVKSTRTGWSCRLPGVDSH